MSTPGEIPVGELALVERLRRLLQKYELLIRLRQGEPGRTAERRDAMRAIAERFPAALREWEEQPVAELDRRRRLVAAQLAQHESPGGAGDLGAVAPAEDWLRYGLDLHDCLRAVLQLRRYLSRQAGGRLPRGAHAKNPTWPSAEQLLACQKLVRDCEVPWLTVTPELLQAIIEPAAGRLTALAYQAVARRHGISEATIKVALFKVSDP